MSILSDNIRVLRIRKDISQQKLADDLVITRVRYAKYENGTSEPPIEILIRLSQYFKISIDLLVSVDIRKYPLEEMLNLPNNRVILPIAVDKNGDNRIEIVPQKTSMGYLSGYTDPGYIESLQNISLPFLRNGKYRAFPAQGDSMPPFKDGTFIVGKFIENLTDLKVNKTYIFVTQSEGITYKRLHRINENSLIVKADNTNYQPYEIPLMDLMEIWQFSCAISTKEYQNQEFASQDIQEMFSEIQSQMKRIENHLKS